ncbi:hypothetical protein [Anaerobium acetethylicum]|uniref:hypothetical protein n=1 Tax=Anaerobium acetethylicum TaxID=1619234 RepID=UPI001A9A55DD|nr:hypothetical protein [Anaerobium acetethylicum]
MNYNRSYYNGSYDYVLVKLISFKLEREIYTSAPFDGFRRATALVSQVGTIGGPGNPAVLNNQLKTYSNISYGTLYAAPSEWLAVLSDYVEGFKGVKYSIPIIYANGTTSTCTYIHSMR